MNAEKKDQTRSEKKNPFLFDLPLSVLSAFICVLFFCAVCPAQIHPHSFSPRQLGIMQAWYRADIITALADGDPVASWVDSTANARTLAQGAADYRPAYKVSIQNGRPAIRFDGQNDYFDAAAVGMTQWTIFSIQRPNAVSGGGDTLYFQNPSYNVFSRLLNSSHLSFGFYSGAAWSDYNPVHVVSFTVPEVWCLVFDAVGWKSWVNGNPLTPQGETLVPSGVGTQLRVGSYWHGFDADVFELLFFAEALSDRDRQRVERYLMRKWGL